VYPITPKGAAVPNITRNYTGRMHTGYTVENEAGAVATVVQGKRGGYFVRTEADVFHVAGLLDAREIAMREVGA
jgi:hypothetical protein